MGAEKESLRAEYMRRRDGISADLAGINCDAIRARLARVPEFAEARSIAAYCSTGSEVGTGDMLRDILARNILLCLPRTKRDGLDFRQVSNLDLDLQMGEYGIPEPRPVRPECTGHDVILVPAVCATRQCQRIGYGKGYYDRYLQKSEAFTIGIVHGVQVVKSVPTDAHDVPLDMIITEKHTYRR